MVSRPRKGRSQTTDASSARRFFSSAPGQPGVPSGFNDLLPAAPPSQLLTPMKSNLAGKPNCVKTSMKDKPTMKTGSSLVHLLLVMCAFLCTQLPSAHAADSVPTVTTDQEDYPPFSVVWITGTGFQPGETVSNQVVQVEGPAPGTAYEPWGVVADTAGNFATSWYVFSDELLNTTLRL